MNIYWLSLLLIKPLLKVSMTKDDTPEVRVKFYKLIKNLVF